VVIADDNPVVRAGLSALLGAREDIEVVAEAADGRQALAAAERCRPDVVLLDVRMPGVDGLSALPHLVGIAPVMMLTYSSESEIVREALRLGAGGYVVHGEFTAEQLVAAVRDLKAGRAYFTTSAQDALLAHMRAGPAAADPVRPLPEGLGSVYTTGVPYSGRGTTGQDGRHRGSEPPVSSSELSRQNSSQVQPVVAHYPSRTEPGTVNRQQFRLSSREVEVMDLIAAGMSNQQIAATCFISEKTVKNHINRIFAKLHSTSRSEAIATWVGTRTAGSGNGSGNRGGVIGRG
jgi:DNA-binding NarL/FixJ family response regulator